MPDVTDDRPLSQRFREPERILAPLSLAVAENGPVVNPERRGEAILRAPVDADCRSTPSVVGITVPSADYISEVRDPSTSTTYRKTDTLTDLGLLVNGGRLRDSGHGVREYIWVSETVSVRFDHGNWRFGCSDKRSRSTSVPSNRSEPADGTSGSTARRGPGTRD
jgi:hypothetical protein